MSREIGLEWHQALWGPKAKNFGLFKTSCKWNCTTHHDSASSLDPRFIGGSTQDCVEL